jgi:hypothetical protein
MPVRGCDLSNRAIKPAKSVRSDYAIQNKAHQFENELFRLKTAVGSHSSVGILYSFESLHHAFELNLMTVNRYQ